jgi:hypothetical protein
MQQQDVVIWFRIVYWGLLLKNMHGLAIEVFLWLEEEILLNLLLWNYLHYNLYDHINKL